MNTTRSWDFIGILMGDIFFVFCFFYYLSSIWDLILISFSWDFNGISMGIMIGTYGISSHRWRWKIAHLMIYTLKHPLVNKQFAIEDGHLVR
jgi:hypothetical protein